MFDHVSIGVRDLARAKRFYDAALAPLSYKCLRESPTLLGYGDDSVALWISPTATPVPPDPESGLHFCFAAPASQASRSAKPPRLSLGAGLPRQNSVLPKARHRSSRAAGISTALAARLRVLMAIGIITGLGVDST